MKDLVVTPLLSLFRRLAAGQRIEPAEAALFADRDLQAAVRRHGLGPLAWSAGLEAFRHEYLASHLDARAREKQWLETCAVLGAAGIRFAPIKGAMTAVDLYPEPALRPMSDIDLLVPPVEFDAAAAALERSGYSRTLGPEVSIATSATLTLERLENEEADPIDLHATILHPLRCRLDLAAVWARASPGEGLFAGAWRLDPVDEALFHFAHAARHELDVPLINYLDGVHHLAQLGGAGRDTLLERAREARMGRAVALAMAATDALREGREALAAGPIVSRLLPNASAVARCLGASRAHQLARKIILAEGVRELWGLAVIAWRRRTV